MRKFLYFSLVVLALGFLATSCKKDTPTLPTEQPTGEVQFTINQSDFGGLKDASDTIPECSE